MKPQLDSYWWLLIIILVTATALRLYGLDYSFTNDELSALSRLNFDSLSALISKGIRVDGHPAFTQLLLYIWTPLSGLTETGVRLPFVIFGVGSILMVYLIGKDWFGVSVGLYTAATMAGLQFFIMYSQLARPYSPGLFFTCITAFFWGRILLNRTNRIGAMLAGFFTALAMLTHYFSFMQVVFLAILGLFMLNKKNSKNCMLAAVTALVIWLPHLEITLYQLSLGGVGQWLGAPEEDYLWKFLQYLFNDHTALAILICVIGLAGVFLAFRFRRFSKWQLICLLLFILPFLTGYFYSVMINPVLQFSTLIFASPFLVMLIFSFYPPQLSRGVTIAVTLILLGANSISTIAYARYYQTENFGVFKELAEKVKEWDETYGSSNVTKIAHLNSHTYLAHYFEQLQHPVELGIWNINSDSSRSRLREHLEQANEPYLAFAWSNIYVPDETYEMIRSEYPAMVEHVAHFNSGAYLFSRKGTDERTPQFSYAPDFSQSTHKYLSGLDQNKLTSDSARVGYLMIPNDEYSWNFSASAGEIGLEEGELLVISLHVRAAPPTKATLVLEVNSPNREKEWKGNNLEGFVIPGSNEHEILLTYKATEEISPEDQIKSYVWKRSPDSLLIEKFSARVYSAHY